MHKRFFFSVVEHLDWLAIAAFAIWGFLGLGQTTFTLDEAVVIAPAISFLDHGYMSIPMAGPGHGHESAYLYQLPLHSVLLALDFKVFGVGLFQGRALSLILAVIVLILVAIIMRRYGSLESAIAVCVLAVDWYFAFRARQIRYDSLAMVGLLFSYGILSGDIPSVRLRALGSTRWPFWSFLAGIMAGLALISYFLYALAILLLIGMTILLPADHNRPLKRRLHEVIAFLLGMLLPVIPVATYALLNLGAFKDQFLFQLTSKGTRLETPITWFYWEIRKYWTYYVATWPIPFLLLSNFGCVAALAVSVLRLRKSPQQQNEEPQHNRALQRLATVCITLPLLLGIFSRHLEWHHLMVVPFWAMACGACAIWVRKRNRLIRRSYVLLVSLALVNGLIVSWGMSTYAALRGWNARHVEVIERQITSYIPNGSYVYSTDYRFEFVARRHQWRFVCPPYFLNTDTTALAKEQYDYVIASDWEARTSASRAFLDLTQYHLVGSVYHTHETIFPPPWTATKFEIFAYNHN